jgi:hypothetical protein
MPSETHSRVTASDTDYALKVDADFSKEGGPGSHVDSQIPSRNVCSHFLTRSSNTPIRRGAVRNCATFENNISAPNSLERDLRDHERRGPFASLAAPLIFDMGCDLLPSSARTGSKSRVASSTGYNDVCFFSARVPYQLLSNGGVRNEIRARNSKRHWTLGLLLVPVALSTDLIVSWMILIKTSGQIRIKFQIPCVGSLGL